MMLGVYWLSYFATVRTATSVSYVVFSSFTGPDYRVPLSMRAVAHRMFEPAFFVDSHLLRPAKWDAFRPPPVLQPASQSR